MQRECNLGFLNTAAKIRAEAIQESQQKQHFRFLTSCEPQMSNSQKQKKLQICNCVCNQSVNIQVLHLELN